MTEDQHVSIKGHGETLAEATISPPDDHGEMQVDVSIESGHLPMGTRQSLADAIHDVVTEVQGVRVSATVPLGDAEMVEGIGDHLNHVELRAAGATSIIEGTVAGD